MIISKITDLNVGDRVKHYGDESPETGVIVKLEATGYRGGIVVLKTDGNDHESRRYFDGIDSDNRVWTVLKDVEPAKPEVAVGDTVKVTRVIEGVVLSLNSEGCALKGHGWLYFETPNEVRTIEVVKKALLPWQAGDMVRGSATRKLLVRQADGSWVDERGGVTKVTDGDAGDRIVIVRGGVRQ